MERYAGRYGRAVRTTGLFVLMASLVGAPAAAQQPAPPPTPPAEADRPALFKEPSFIARNIGRAEQYTRDEREGRRRDGFYPELGHMMTGSGWISAGPGFRQHVFNDQALVDVSAAVSWRAYKAAQARFELPYLADERLTIGAKALWQDLTQVRYYGAGSDTTVAGVSDYRLESANVVGYANWSATPALTVSASGGWLRAPRLMPSAGTFDRDDPDTLVVHSMESAANLIRQPSYLHGEAALTFDTRDHPGYPTRGGLYRAAGSRFHDRSGRGFSFDRVELEAARFIPVASDRGVIALHWWTVLSHTAAGQQVPFYMLPSLGGHNTLRSFADYRFHDRHMMVATIESRWALFPHIDGAVFLDAGNVAARIGDLDLGHTSAGFGIRLHTRTSTLARFDIARGDEGWRFVFKMTDVLRLARLARRTAPLPFVP
jgi:hypothetical protein